MSDDSGGAASSGGISSTEPLDVPNMTNPVQEAEHDVANSCSKLAVNPNESLPRFLYQSPQSASVTASLLSGRLSMTFSVASSLAHVKEDEQEYQNEDATQYSRQSSEGSSQDTPENLQDARTSQQPPCEDDDLPTPIQAEETDSDKETLEMVVTKDYNTASLMSNYCLIQKREEISAISKDIDEVTPLFAMDDDEPTQGVNKADSDSPSGFISRLSLNFAKEESINHIPNPSVIAGSAGSSANGQPIVEDESHTPVEPPPVAVPNPIEHIDKVDQHRESNNYRVANRGGITHEIQRDKLVLSITDCIPQVDYNLPKFTVGDTKVESMLHPQGKDQDYTDNKVSLTSILQLPKYARNSDSLYAQPNCAIKLSAKAYKGSAEKKILLGQGSSNIQKLKEDERQNLLVHMTVHNVASHLDIFYSRCSEKIFVMVKAELLY